MKTLFFLIISLLIQIRPYANTYYFSITGDDNHSAAEAQSPYTPWQTLKKASSFNFQPGDSILFKRGDIFNGQLVIHENGTAGNPIVYGSYGSGEKPVITGAVKVTDWEPHEGNTFVAGISGWVSQVFIDGNPQTNAREPDNGYFQISEVISEYTKFRASVPDLEGEDWTGASAHIRSKPWSFDAREVVSYNSSNGTFEIGSKSPYSLHSPQPFFVNNHINAIDQPGEWYYSNSENKLYIQLGDGLSPGDLNIKATTVESGVSIYNAQHIVIKGFTIRYHDIAGIELYDGSSDIHLINNTIDYPYGYGIVTRDGADQVIKNNNIFGSNRYGIYCKSPGSVIEQNHVSHIGMINRFNGEGISCCQARGIDIKRGNIIVRRNTLDSIGYNAIGFAGTDNLIEENVIRYYCLTTYDGSGIYTWSADYDDPGAEGTLIRKNLIIGGSGPGGAMDFHVDNWGGSDWWFNGIYLDDRTHDIRVVDNTVYNTYRGIFLHNTKRHIIRGNRVYGSISSSVMLTEDHNGGAGTMTDNIFKNNKIFSLNHDVYPLVIKSNFKSTDLADFDSNKYYNPYSEHNIRLYNSAMDSSMRLSEWRKFSGDDIHSVENDFFWNASANYAKFVYNAGHVAKTIPLGDQTWMALNLQHYNKNITLPPFGSRVLLPDTIPHKDTVPLISSALNELSVKAGSDCQATLPDYTNDQELINALKFKKYSQEGEQEYTGNLQISQDPSPGTTIMGTNNKITLIARDDQGDTTQLIFNVAVTDYTAPDITSTHGDTELEIGTPLPDYTTDVTANDNCDEQLDVTQSPAPGNEVYGRNNLILLTVTDNAGNSDQTSFTILATDQTPPEIDTTNFDDTLNAGNDCQATLPNYTKRVEVEDNYDWPEQLKITQSPPPYSSVSEKENTVTITVTDQAGNSSQITFPVTVVDQNKPRLTCPADSTASLKQGKTVYTISGTAFDPVSVEDNCALASVTNNLNHSATLDGVELQKGITTVIWTATDHAGNETQCSMDMTINAFTGMEDKLKQAGIFIYPNPVQHILHVESLHQPVEYIKISDITGKMVMKQNMQGKKGTINLSHLHNGMYYVKLTTKDKHQYTTKIVKE